MLIWGTFKGDDNTVACRSLMSRKAQPVLELSLTCRSAGQGDPTGLLAWRGSEKRNLDLSFQTYSFNTRAADLWAKYRFLLCVGHVKWQVSFCELNSRVKICTPPHSSLDLVLPMSQSAGERQLVMGSWPRPTVLGSQESYLSALALIHRRYSGVSNSSALTSPSWEM